MKHRFHIRRNRISREERLEQRIIAAWMRRKGIVTGKDMFADLHKRPLHNKLYELDVRLLRKKPPRRLPRRPNSRHEKIWGEVKVK